MHKRKKAGPTAELLRHSGFLSATMKKAGRLARC